MVCLEVLRRELAGVDSRASPGLPFPLLGPRAETGFLTFSLRFSDLSRAARAGPPFLPPLPAKPIAAGLLCFAAIRRLCARDHRDTAARADREECPGLSVRDRKSTRLNSSHL